MAHSFENRSLHWPVSVEERWVACYRHRERIEVELRNFLPPEQARETAGDVYNLAMEADREIDRILKDPLAKKLYKYDGRFLTPRGCRGFHTTFDGMHLLEWLTGSMLATFFRVKDKNLAVHWLLDELGKHVWVATRRRMNWEESNSLDLVPKAVLEAIAARSREPSPGLSPLSPEEQAFFASFEKQMTDCLHFAEAIDNRR